MLRPLQTIRPLVLRVDGNERTLGATVANQVYVQRAVETDKANA